MMHMPSAYHAARRPDVRSWDNTRHHPSHAEETVPCSMVMDGYPPWTDPKLRRRTQQIAGSIGLHYKPNRTEVGVSGFRGRKRASRVSRREGGTFLLHETGFHPVL
jgi:hypothetical protein